MLYVAIACQVNKGFVRHQQHDCLEPPHLRKGSWPKHHCTATQTSNTSKALLSHGVRGSFVHAGSFTTQQENQSDLQHVKVTYRFQSNAAAQSFEPCLLVLQGLSCFNGGWYLGATGAFESQAAAYAVTVCCQKRCRASNKAKTGLSKASSLLHAAAAAWAGGVALQCMNFDSPERAVSNTLTADTHSLNDM